MQNLFVSPRRILTTTARRLIKLSEMCFATGTGGNLLCVRATIDARHASTCRLEAFPMETPAAVPYEECIPFNFGDDTDLPPA
jgi:hypothetical protein